MNDRLTVTAVVTNKCNFRCLNCVAGCPSDGPEIDFDSMLNWLDKYAKGCCLHISGGEPLLVDGIFEKIKKCIDAGHDVSLFTNGSMIAHNMEMLKLPIKWHITHHAEGMSLGDFLHCIGSVKNKKHVVCRLRHGDNALNKKNETEAKYGDFNFKWIVPYNGYFGYDCKSKVDVCNKILMIGIDGKVYPCSTVKKGEIGNIYDMTFNTEHTDNFTCGSGSTCQALQSAEIMRNI